MIQPNWFDKKYQNVMANSTAEDSLLMIAKDPQVIHAVREALAFFDANQPGPSRTQAIRGALINILQGSLQQLAAAQQQRLKRTGGFVGQGARLGEEINGKMNNGIAPIKADIVIATTAFEDNALLVKIPITKALLPKLNRLIPIAKTVITDNTILVGVGNLIHLDVPGDYIVNVGDIIQITFGYPIYPSSSIKNIRIDTSNKDIVSMISILQIPPEHTVGSGAIAAFLTVKTVGTVSIDATPVDFNGKDIIDRTMHLNLTIELPSFLPL